MFKWIEQNRWWLSFSLIGLILLVSSLLFLTFTQEKEPAIEIISSGQTKEASLLFVHLEGAVEHPGVYEMPQESRLNDLLIRAGGLSAQADRVWVSQNLNLAQKLADGAKIMIPVKGEIKGLASSTSLPKKININQASLSQLDTLEGIGQKRAQDIIEGRPYQTIEELATRKILSEGVFEKIKDEISAY